MTGLAVASYVVLSPPAIAGKIVSHVELDGAHVLTCWHDGWEEYLRRMSLWQFDRVNVRPWGASGKVGIVIEDGRVKEATG